MTFCNECNIKRMCNRCNDQINENKEFEAILISIKRQAPNELGYMLTYFKEKFFCLLSVLVHLLYALANFLNSWRVYVFD